MNLYAIFIPELCDTDLQNYRITDSDGEDGGGYPAYLLNTTARIHGGFGPLLFTTDYEVWQIARNNVQSGQSFFAFRISGLGNILRGGA